MKKILFAVLVFLLSTSPTYAQTALYVEKELEDRACSTNQPVVDVETEVINDVDVTDEGKIWAFDTSTRTIKVWEQDENTYCAIVTYEGTYDAVAGESPGGRGTLLGNESGNFEGGYRAIIRGELKNRPTWKTQGILEIVDYKCTLSGECEGYENWVLQYFNPNYSFSFRWWGWKYNGIQNNVWENTIKGNRGDIAS